VKEFLEYVLRELVDYPDEVLVVEVPREHSVLFRVRVRSTDVGKVIGVQGRTIASLRSLLNAAGARSQRKAHIEIMEERNQPAEVAHA